MSEKGKNVQKKGSETVRMKDIEKTNKTWCIT